MRRHRLLATLGLLVTLAVRAVAATADLTDGHGIRVESVRQIDDRQLDVRVATDALQQPVDVRILLPATYDDAPRRRFPVLYLFHGTSGRASDWVRLGDAVATTADLPLIVVMPDMGFDADGGGWFANWWNGGARGQPMWETFHLDQVIPWIDANLRTIRRRDGRAIAGLSQGGFGALSYAARRPELFTSAAAFSGGCEIDRDAEAIETSTLIIRYTTTALSGVADPDAIFGPRDTNALNWKAHDPATLVTNLRGLHIGLWTGDGTPGALDGPGTPPSDPIEVVTFGATQLFHGHLEDAGIPSTYVFYGGGTHTWPYWARDLREYVGPLMERFAERQRKPRTVDYMSAADEWTQWGWTVALERPAPAFSRLHAARRTGFLLTGTGQAVVRTPALYGSGARLRVVQRGAAGRSARVLRADGRGRLRIPVGLGDDATETTTQVTIRPAAGG